MRRLLRFLRHDRGATSVEYAVMIGLIIVVAFLAIGLVGSRTCSLWNGIYSSLQSAGVP